MELVSEPPDVLQDREGAPSVYSCPECGGTLWEIREGGYFRFRCHTEHGFSPESLMYEQKAHLEHALWTATRVLRERATLHRQMAERCAARGMTSTAKNCEDRAIHEDREAQLLRDLMDETRLRQGNTTPVPAA